LAPGPVIATAKLTGNCPLDTVSALLNFTKVGDGNSDVESSNILMPSVGFLQAYSNSDNAVTHDISITASLENFLCVYNFFIDYDLFDLFVMRVGLLF